MLYFFRFKQNYQLQKAETLSFFFCLVTELLPLIYCYLRLSSQLELLQPLVFFCTPWQYYKSLAFFRFMHARAEYITVTLSLARDVINPWISLSAFWHARAEYINETLAFTDYHGFLLSQRAIKHIAVLAQQ